MNEETNTACQHDLKKPDPTVTEVKDGPRHRIMTCSVCGARWHRPINTRAWTRQPDSAK